MKPRVVATFLAMEEGNGAADGEALSANADARRAAPSLPFAAGFCAELRGPLSRFPRCG
jgi:hypothetical protein